MQTFRVKVNHRGNWILVRLQTSAGISGLGEASHGASDDQTLEYLRQLFPLVENRTIHEIELLYRGAAPLIARDGYRAAVALSALEQCLWDIAGKVQGVPAHSFFGGKLTDRVRVYANINRATVDRTPAGFARMAESAVKAGFDAVKLDPFDGDRNDGAKLMRAGLEVVRAVRGAIGANCDLLVDCHSKFNVEDGLTLLRESEPLKLFWIEEVTPAKPLDGLATINRASSMPTAGGESLSGPGPFYEYVRAGAADIIMPDVKYCGGMLNLKKIAAIGEGAGLKVAPHGPASPVGNMAAAHVSATMPNFLILEYAFGEVDWRAQLVEPPEEIIQGRMQVPDRPGLGIVLNERVAAQHRVS